MINMEINVDGEIYNIKWRHERNKSSSYNPFRIIRRYYRISSLNLLSLIAASIRCQAFEDSEIL